MIQSMTSFARGTGPSKEGGWVVEIRSVNHRFFDFSLKVPHGFQALETRIRDLVQPVMPRGKVMVSVSQEKSVEKKKPLKVDESVVSSYLSSLKKVGRKFGLKGEITVSDVLRFPGVLNGEESATNPEKDWIKIKKVLATTLVQVTKARKLEGGKLSKDIASRLDSMSARVAQIEKYAKGQSARLFKRTQDRIRKLLGEEQKDRERIHREVAFLAERTDITEELVRMHSHLKLFKSRLKQSQEVGRELDFLCQEMNREINTMASKAQHFDISTEVVAIKGELEKIREQIQNIE